MIIEITEGQIGWLPGVRPTELPSLPDDISIRLAASGVVGLLSQSLVGAILTRTGTTVQITPKIGRVNFLRLLFRAEGSKVDLDVDTDVEYGSSDERSIDAIAARQLMYGVDRMLRLGVEAGRVRDKVRTSTFVGGRLDLAKTHVGLHCRAAAPFVSVVRRRTLATAEHRVLTSAMRRALSYVGPDDRERCLPVWERWVRCCPAEASRSDLLLVEERLASSFYVGPRDYYRKLLVTAKVVLGTSGVLLGGRGELLGTTHLLRTSLVFERYVRAVVAETLADRGYNVVRTSAGAQTLYTNGEYTLKPDIVISRYGVPLLVADAKYKKPTADDHYQIVAYMNGYGVSRGILVCAGFAGEEARVKEYSTADGGKVLELYLPMQDLSRAERVLSELVAKYSS